MHKRQAVLDADFTMLLCEYNGEDFFVKFMDALEVQPVMSWYVANAELINCQPVKELIKKGIITVIYPDDFLKEQLAKNLFKKNVNSVVSKVNSTPLPNQTDIFSPDFHFSESHVGEIISELMAKELGLELFASNDWGAKRYAKSYINSANYTLQVKNIAELFDEIAEKGKTSNINWKDVKRILSSERWKKERDLLRIKWITNNNTIQ